MTAQTIPQTILRIDSTARKNGSSTRELTSQLIDVISGASTHVINRDLADGLPFLTEDWVNANFTPDEERSDAQRETLAVSDSLIEELKAADTVVIGLPIYNFGVPAVLKAWVDLIARARVTFRYTENGPEGLLTGKRAFLVVASGGTQVGSEIDFASSYMRHALKFVGITDVTVIDAGQAMLDAEAALERAQGQIADAVSAKAA